MCLLYLEFIYPIWHYFRTIKLNEFVFDLILPILIGCAAALLIYWNNCIIASNEADSLFKTIITLLSILVGFTISSITILTSTSQKLEQTITERKIGKDTINLYQLTNIIFIFTLFSEIFTLIVNLVAVVMLSYNVHFITTHLNEFIIVDLILLSHVLFLNIRNMSNFYFILHGIGKDSKNES